MTLDDIINFIKEPEAAVIRGAQALNSHIETNVDEAKFMMDDPEEWARRRALMAGQDIEEWVDNGGMMDLAMIGSIHGTKSNLFGGKGMIKKMQDWEAQGLTPKQISEVARKETGFNYFPQHLYKDGRHYRTDLKMDVPNTGMQQTRYGISDIANLDKRQDYLLSDFIEDPTLELGYPGIINKTRVQIGTDAEMLGAPMQIKSGKYGEPTVVRINEEIAGIEESLLPKIAHELQHEIDKLEGHPPGGSLIDKNYTNLSGEVDARAVETQRYMIDELQGKGLNPGEIRDYLSLRPIQNTFDTPDILRVINDRRKGHRTWEAATPDSTLATHQIDSGAYGNLERGIDKGGFPSPSIGISTLASKGDRSYFGPINLIGNRELITPSKTIDVWADDSYTATHPKPDQIRDNNLYTLDSISNFMTESEPVVKQSYFDDIWPIIRKGEAPLRDTIQDIMLGTPKKLSSLDEVLAHSRDVYKSPNMRKSVDKAESAIIEASKKYGITPADLLELLAAHRIIGSKLPEPLQGINRIFDARPNQHGYLEAKPRRAVNIEEFPAILAPDAYYKHVQQLLKPYGTKVINESASQSTRFSPDTLEELDKLDLLFD